jgi:hypothetical protein
MKIKAFVDKGVLSQMAIKLNSFSNLQEKIDSGNIIDITNYINKCNEWYCDDFLDFDSTDPGYIDLLTLLGKDGCLPVPVPKTSSFTELVKNSTPYGLFIFNQFDSCESAALPSFSLNELIKIVKDKDKNFEPIISDYPNNAFKVFRKYSYFHKINSIIINDRYIFDSKNQVVVISKLLQNYLHETQIGNVVITIFYTQHEDYQYDNLEIKITDILKIYFPKSSFTVEVVPVKHIDENHDRLMFTDFISCHTGHSFTFLNYIKATVTYDRHLLIDSYNFRNKLNYLEEFLNSITSLNPNFKTKNEIINAFIKP